MVTIDYLLKISVSLRVIRGFKYETQEFVTTDFHDFQGFSQMMPFDPLTQEPIEREIRRKTGRFPVEMWNDGGRGPLL